MSRTSATKSVRLITAGLVTSCFIGLGLSYYAYIVEITKEKDENYKALCDISERISCSKVFLSEYGKGFGIIPETSIFYLPNPIYGLAFYALVAVLSVSKQRIFSLTTVLVALLSNILSFYLAYVLYLLNDICVVCVATYLVNAIISILAIMKYRRLGRNGTQKKKKKH